MALLANWYPLAKKTLLQVEQAAYERPGRNKRIETDDKNGGCCCLREAVLVGKFEILDVSAVKAGGNTLPYTPLFNCVLGGIGGSGERTLPALTALSLVTAYLLDAARTNAARTNAVRTNAVRTDGVRTDGGWHRTNRGR